MNYESSSGAGLLRDSRKCGPQSNSIQHGRMRHKDPPAHTMDDVIQMFQRGLQSAGLADFGLSEILASDEESLNNVVV
jgi:hypothetical protein